MVDGGGVGSGRVVLRLVGGGGSWCGGGRVTGSVTGSVINSGGGWCACGRVVVVWVVMVWSGW